MKNKQIEALEKLIVLKNETIKELERQVQLLKNQPPIVIPQTQPDQPLPIGMPSVPVSPQWPYTQLRYGPYIITSGSNATLISNPNCDGSTNTINLVTNCRTG